MPAMAGQECVMGFVVLVGGIVFAAVILACLLDWFAYLLVCEDLKEDE